MENLEAPPAVLGSACLNRHARLGLRRFEPGRGDDGSGRRPDLVMLRPSGPVPPPARRSGPGDRRQRGSGPGDGRRRRDRDDDHTADHEHHDDRSGSSDPCAGALRRQALRRRPRRPRRSRHRSTPAPAAHRGHHAPAPAAAAAAPASSLPPTPAARPSPATAPTAAARSRRRPNALYNCQNGSTASKQNCPAGCKVNPPGVADACNPQGDPCANANSGNGAYCGASLGGGDPNVLYNCQNRRPPRRPRAAPAAR